MSRETDATHSAGTAAAQRDLYLRQPRVPGDLQGYELKPDPLAARSAADLILALREYRVWAGDPSFRTMARKAAQRVSASALCVALGDAALHRDELPRLPVIIAVVAACGGDQDDHAAWATAWRLLRMGKRPAEARPALRAVASG